MPEESKIILHPQGLEGWTIVRVGHKQGDLFLKLVATDTAEHASPPHSCSLLVFLRKAT
jgi:hypothetical protein